MTSFVPGGPLRSRPRGPSEPSPRCVRMLGSSPLIERRSSLSADSLRSAGWASGKKIGGSSSPSPSAAGGPLEMIRRGRSGSTRTASRRTVTRFVSGSRRLSVRMMRGNIARMSPWKNRLKINQGELLNAFRMNRSAMSSRSGARASSRCDFTMPPPRESYTREGLRRFPQPSFGARPSSRAGILSGP